MNIELPCSGTTLPTKAEFVQVYNDILMIPSKLKAYSVANPDLDVEVQKQIDDAIKQVEDFAELQSSILSPYWQNGQIQNWQKEANDAWSELIDEFHMYIPVKMLELISDLIPISFTVTVMGISVDLLKVLEKDEQERIKKQITDQVDVYYNMVPDAYQYYKGEFGIICDEWKGKLTWAYFKNELVKWCTSTLQAAFEALIEEFKDIWDALGLPSIPTLLDFDVATWIRAQIDAFKQQAQDYADGILAQIDQLKEDSKNLVGDAKKSIDDEIDKQQKIIDEFSINGYVIDQLRGVSLFGMSLLDIIGGEIDTNVICPEDQINELVRAARDWFAQWQKELLLMWVNEIKEFLDAIGLSALLDFLTLTFCDVLKLIGIPTSIDLTLPELPQIDAAVSV
tara:strand:+ start:3256 stop:4443 length:1188 start_codon:yes stop_codon:yes gene_type:complete